MLLSRVRPTDEDLDALREILRTGAVVLRERWSKP